MSVLHLSDSSKWVVKLHFDVHKPPPSDVNACIFFNEDPANSVCRSCRAGESCFPTTLELERTKTAQSGVRATWIARAQPTGVSSIAEPRLGPNFGSGMQTAGLLNFSYVGALITTESGAPQALAQTPLAAFRATL